MSAFGEGGAHQHGKPRIKIKNYKNSYAILQLLPVPSSDPGRISRPAPARRCDTTTGTPSPSSSSPSQPPPRLALVSRLRLNAFLDRPSSSSPVSWSPSPLSSPRRSPLAVRLGAWNVCWCRSAMWRRRRRVSPPCRGLRTSPR